MKNKYFIALVFILIAWASNAQQLSFQKQLELMDQKKLEGKATGKEQLVNPDAPKSISRVSSPTNPGNNTTSACNCWIPRDATWLIAPMNGSGASGGPGVAPLYRNDDWSTPLINLPFNLCFYGQTINQIYINNNGNISIGAPYSTFTANSFPDPSYVMIAPFWGDVDTRGATSGVVYYKVTPTYMIVQWENVGYFPSAVDKLNTFQLIMTDGNDPILGPGNNVSFCYQDMQWTTGGASGGVGGFGGTPATVGVNQGNGVDYIQFGLFDQAGGVYDGPFGSNDGIDWLDNQNFTFSFCTSGANIPPVLNTLNVCDTIFLCQGQTVNYTANYYAPEMGQVTNIVLNPGSLAGINVVSNTPGNTAAIDFSITGVTPGIYTFQLVATDDGTPAGITTNNIVVRVYPSPTANASFLPASPVQTNTAVQFTNLSSPGSLLTWNFGDGTPNSSLPNPSHTYTAPGTYTVSLTAMFPNGCSTTWTSQIVVQSCATSPFTTTNVCQGNPTTITYTGVASASAVFNWNFAGATVLSGSGRGPYSVQWSTPGSYNVSLTVVDGGCTSATTTVPATVYQNPVATISSIPNLCTGASTNISFTGTAGAGATYNWNFGTATVNSGSGAGPYNVQWNTPGNYSVALTVSENGCTNSTTVNATVNAIPTANFTATPAACANSPVTINYTGTGTGSGNYNWNFNGATVNSGSGSGPYSISFANGGAYNVSLTVTENGCTSTPVNQPVSITDNPVAAIAATASLCINAANGITYSGTSIAGAAYTWNFDNGTVASGSGAGPYSVSWSNPGNYNVTVSVNQNGCTSTANFPVTINAIPTSNFTLPAAICANNPLNVNYTGTASGSATYNWTFTGATVNSGTGAGPYSLNYANGGNYYVTLTVTENGCTSTPSQSAIAVTDNPVAAISSTPALCVNASNTINYSGTSVIGASYTWNFDNGTVASGSGSGPYSVSWTNPGNYNVTVSVNQNGCTSTANVPVTIYAIPTSNFTLPAAVCANNPVAVNYTGSATGSATYNWSFTGATVNGGTGAGPYDLSYTSGGNYNVSLTVTENGCTSTPSQMAIVVTDNPVASISSTPALCVNANNAINYSGTAVAGASYTWNFDNGTVASGSGSGPYTVSWSTAGIYSVSVSVNQNGCTSSANVPVTIYPIPTSDFTVTPSACANAPVNVSYSGTGSAGATYAWNFGGGTGGGTGAGPHVLTFASGGNYTVSLTVSENGCTGTPVQFPVSITDNPVAAFTSTPSLCANDNNAISFTGSAMTSANFNWNFSGGTIALGSGSGPYSVSWATPGNYTVSLSIDQNGCTAQTTSQVIVNYIPTSDFNVTPAVCVGNPVTVSYNGNGTSTANFQWNFNGGTVNSGSGSGPYSIQYTSLGTNQISLVVSENGCTSTVSIQQTNVNPIPAVDAGTNDTVCSGVVVNVGALSPVPGAAYTWSPSTNVADPYAAQTTITPNNATTTNQQIDYTLTIVDANGCVNSDQVTVISYPLPVVNFIPPADQCIDNNNFTFSAISNLPVGVNYSWSFAGGTPAASSLPTENVTYASPGTYPVVLNAEYNGCIAPVFSDLVNVREMPVTDFIPQVFQGCQPLTVPFSNLSSGTGNSYNWAFYDGTSGDTASNPVHVFNSPGIYSVTLTSTNAYGCRTDSTLRNVIVVYPEAIARFTPNPAVANILSPAIQFQNYSTNALTYSWTFGDGDTSLLRNPSHAYADTGSYEVILAVVSPDGCVDTISGIVRVEDNFAFYIPNAFTPNGDGVNDTFRGFGVAMRSYSMSIYNRWGELIYRTNDYNQAWDGKVKDVVQNDVYVYRIEIVDNRDEKHIYLGNVSVVR